MSCFAYCLRAQYTPVHVSQLPADAMEIWQENGSLTIQRKDIKGRECILEIAQYISISYNQGASRKQ